MWTPPDTFLENEASTQEQREHLDTVLRQAMPPPVDGEPLVEEMRALIQKLIDAAIIQVAQHDHETLAAHYSLTEKGKQLAMPLLRRVRPRSTRVPRNVELNGMAAWELFCTLLS